MIRRQRQSRNRRVALAVGSPLAALALIVMAFVLVGARSTDSAQPLAAPISTSPVSAGKPPEVVIARGEGVSIKLPVDPAVITAAAFRPIGDPGSVPMESSGALNIRQVDRGDLLGPATSGLDIGAPAGTPVYAAVDGIVVSIGDYKVAGRIEGFEIAIAPDAAAQGVIVRMTHLDEHERGLDLRVGEPVQAGETLIGRVRDFSGVGRQQLSQFTSDSGNHVHLELIRTQADLFS